MYQVSQLGCGFDQQISDGRDAGEYSVSVWRLCSSSNPGERSDGVLEYWTIARWLFDREIHLGPCVFKPVLSKEGYLSQSCF
jgi:hypothetical protein